MCQVQPEVVFAAEALSGSEGISKIGLDCAGALFCLFFFAFEQNFAFYFKFCLLLPLEPQYLCAGALFGRGGMSRSALN